MRVTSRKLITHPSAYGSFEENFVPQTESCLHIDLMVLFYTDSLNKIRSLFYIKVHEAKKALIKNVSPVNRVRLTVLVSVENTYILCIT